MKPASDNQKEQMLLDRFLFGPPAASLTDVETVEMKVAEDLETEPKRSASARTDV